MAGASKSVFDVVKSPARGRTIRHAVGDGAAAIATRRDERHCGVDWCVSRRNHER
jgi:hypothetical protein